MRNYILKLKIISIFLIIFSGTFCFVEISRANVAVPWSSTFNCADWAQGDTWPPSGGCDGMDLINDGWYPTCSNKPSGKSEINVSLNNPLGTGKGMRQVIGDGSNSQGAAPRITFTSSHGEIWMRWYVRYEAGFVLSTVGHTTYHKYAYIRFSPSSFSKVFDILGNTWSLTHQGCDSGGNDYGGTGFTGMNSGSVGDGQWHSVEIHVKIETSGNNGIFEAWMDGVQQMDIHDTNYCGTPITSLTLGTNQSWPTNNNCAYFDYDDIALSTTGYIGPLLAAPDTTPPAAPQGATVN